MPKPGSEPSSKKPLGWAFLGTGAHVWERMGPAAQRAEDTVLVAVASRDPAEAERCARHFGFARAYADYDLLLGDPAVDVVYIATPNALHPEHAIKAMEAGKHVLVEKPLGLSELAATVVVAASRRLGVALGVGYHLRHHPAHVEAERIVREGALGEVRFATLQFGGAAAAAGGWWRDPESVGSYIMTRRGVHLVDLMLFLLNRQPRRVMAVTNGQTPERELEDTAIALIELEGDTYVTLAASRELVLCPDMFALYGTSGMVHGVGTFSGKGGGVLDVNTVSEEKRTEFPPLDLYAKEIEAFNHQILRHRRDDPTEVDTLRGVRIADAILQSARRHEAIPLAERDNGAHAVDT